MWFGDDSAETTIKSSIMDQLNAVMGALSQVSLDSIRQNAIAIINYIDQKYETNLTADMLSNMRTTGDGEWIKPSKSVFCINKFLDEKYENLVRMMRDIDETKDEADSAETLFVSSLILLLVV